MNDFISRRRTKAKGRALPVRLADGAPPTKIAGHTTRCPACDNWIRKAEDVIVFDYAQRQWVHDNGKCRSNDTLHMT